MSVGSFSLSVGRYNAEVNIYLKRASAISDRNGNEISRKKQVESE